MHIMSLHGISQDAWNRYTSEGSWYYEVLFSGCKYNMTDIAAAIGIEQLKNCDRFRDARARIARIYDNAFRDLPEIRTPACRSDVLHAWHLYVIQIDLDHLSIRPATICRKAKASRHRHVGSLYSTAFASVLSRRLRLSTARFPRSIRRFQPHHISADLS